MKNILLIAPPAGGKGTISDALVENFGYVHISTGDLLRGLNKNTELGKEVDTLLKAGQMVGDLLVLRLLKDKLKTLDGKPFILDGCPRNLEQAIELDKILKKMGLSLDVVIELDIPYDVVLKRAIGRVSCPKCKANFNSFFKKSEVEGICDKCGSELAKRGDDTEETFKVRYDVYSTLINPVLGFYWKKGILKTVDGVNNTYENVVSAIKK